MNKVIGDANQAIGDIGDGATIMMGGFGLCGIPENLIQALRDQGARDLTVISNNAGIDDFGIGILLEKRQVRKMIATLRGGRTGSSKNWCSRVSWKWSYVPREPSPSASAPEGPASAGSTLPRATGPWLRRARKPGPLKAETSCWSVPSRPTSPS